MPKFQFSNEAIQECVNILDLKDGSDFLSALQVLQADVEKQQNAGKRRWHHHKRGSDYTEQMRGILQIATKPLVEDDILVVYVDDATGRVCIREQGEFEDGRFAEIKP